MYVSPLGAGESGYMRGPDGPLGDVQGGCVALVLHHGEDARVRPLREDRFPQRLYGGARYAIRPTSLCERLVTVRSDATGRSFGNRVAFEK